MSDFLIPLALCLVIVLSLVPLAADFVASHVEAACQNGRADPGICYVVEVSGLVTPAVDGGTP